MKITTFCLLSFFVSSISLGSAIRVYDVDDYVQDGLVAHFDGIRNVGEMLPHDSSTREWTNLVNNQLNARFSTDEYGYWTDDGLGFYFDGWGDDGANKDCYAQLVSGLTLSTKLTVQLAVDIDPTKQSGGTAGKDKYPGYFHGADKDFGVYAANNTSPIKNEIQLKHASSGTKPKVSPWGGKYVTAVVDEDKAYLTENTLLENKQPSTHNLIKDNAVKFCWGGSSLNATRAVKGTYYNVRIYNRVLSPDELLHNRVVDEARFHNEASKGKGNDDVNVIVSSNYEDVDGYEDSGKWQINGENHTFTAPAIRCVNGNGFILVGYTIETWNGESWGNLEEKTSSSCTVSSSDKVRLTWIWKQVLYFKDVEDYTQANRITDYTQDGLILHFDGICNAGVNAPHDSQATSWSNLAAGESKYDAVKKVLASFPSAAKDGVWESDGYRFNGKEFFELGSSILLGDAVTVQLVVDYDNSKAVASYPVFFGTISLDKDNFAVYRVKDNNKLYFKENHSTALQKEIEGNPPYVTAFFDKENNRRCVTELIEPTWSEKSDMKTLEEWNFAMGTAQKSDNRRKERVLVGKIKSLRVYNKILEKAELENNRKVDEARFFSNVTILNGPIENSGLNGESSLPQGSYFLDSDRWTVTAQAVKVDGKTYNPKLVVEKYFNTGELKEVSRSQWLESYTIDKDALGDDSIRLLWTWEAKKGIMVLIR